MYIQATSSSVNSTSLANSANLTNLEKLFLDQLALFKAALNKLALDPNNTQLIAALKEAGAALFSTFQLLAGSKDPQDQAMVDAFTTADQQGNLGNFIQACSYGGDIQKSLHTLLSSWNETQEDLKSFDAKYPPTSSSSYDPTEEAFLDALAVFEADLKASENDPLNPDLARQLNLAGAILDADKALLSQGDAADQAMANDFEKNTNHQLDHLLKDCAHVTGNVQNIENDVLNISLNSTLEREIQDGLYTFQKFYPIGA